MKKIKEFFSFYNMHEIESRAASLSQSQEFRDTIFRHFSGSKSNSISTHLPNLTIHHNDQMLNHSLMRLKSAGAALSQYYSVAIQQYKSADQIIRAFFPDRTNIKVLDFACGYGRMLRFLTSSIDAKNVWASDIQREAVDFVSDQFGVSGICSDVDPAKFEVDEQFDFIWVASLFSHLPDGLFQAWLSKLSSVLSPNGVIGFSVHDSSLSKFWPITPSEGIQFFPHSENNGLDAKAYGTAFVSEAYVSRAVALAFGVSHPYRRLKRGLAYQQDIYVVAKNPSTDLAALNSFSMGPWGWLDYRETRPTGHLKLSGWATSFDQGGLDFVKISYDGLEIRCPVTVERPDVEAVFHDERLRVAGWESMCDLRSGAEDAYLEISAIASDGKCGLLYAGFNAEPHVPYRGRLARLRDHLLFRRRQTR